MTRTATKMTLAEYLAIEDFGDVKLEWVNGQAHAMAGSTPVHSAVSVNVVVALQIRLRGQPCRAQSSDQRVYVVATDAYFFPDVTVVCPPWQMQPGDVMSVSNPSVIVEVLSASTSDYDRGGKLKHYLQIPSITDYLLIDPADRSVTHYTRAEEGWALRFVNDGAVQLRDLGIELPLDEVFSDLDGVPET